MQDAVLRREGSLQAYAEVLISDFHRVGDSRWGGALANSQNWPNMHVQLPLCVTSTAWGTAGVPSLPPSLPPCLATEQHFEQQAVGGLQQHAHLAPSLPPGSSLCPVQHLQRLLL